MLNSFSQGTWGIPRGSLSVGRYTTLTEVRKIVPPYFKMKQMELILRPVFVVIGICASECAFSLKTLFRVVFISV